MSFTTLNNYQHIYKIIIIITNHQHIYKTISIITNNQYFIKQSQLSPIINISTYSYYSPFSPIVNLFITRIQSSLNTITYVTNCNYIHHQLQVQMYMQYTHLFIIKCMWYHPTHQLDARVMLLNNLITNSWTSELYYWFSLITNIWTSKLCYWFSLIINHHQLDPSPHTYL